MTETVMDPFEQILADQVYEAIQNVGRTSERTRQSADYRVGISDLGFCSEKVRRMVSGIPEADTDKLPAFIGTALGDHMEGACAAMWPSAIIQPEVEVVLGGDGGNYRVIGHPDLILPEGKVIDFKTVRGLATVRRTGPNQQQQFQRHCYALGAFEAGLFHDDVNLNDVQVANVWMDRAADERELHVHMEPYSQGVVIEAAMWLDDVVYAFLHEQTARKEPAIEVCRKTCGHFEDCRLGEGDIPGLLTDDAVLVAVDLYQEGAELEKQGRRLKDQAKANLVGVNGSTGKYSVRWIHTNGGEVHFTRKPSDRLDIRPVT